MTLTINQCLFVRCHVLRSQFTSFTSRSIRSCVKGPFRRQARLGTSFSSIHSTDTAPLLFQSNQKLLADLRRQLNVTEGDNVVSLERVLSDPDVKSSKGPFTFHIPHTIPIGRNTSTSAMRKRYPVSDTDNETDTERDEDYHRDDEDGDEDR